MLFSFSLSRPLVACPGTAPPILRPLVARVRVLLDAVLTRPGQRPRIRQTNTAVPPTGRPMIANGPGHPTRGTAWHTSIEGAAAAAPRPSVRLPSFLSPQRSSKKNRPQKKLIASANAPPHPTTATGTIRARDTATTTVWLAEEATSERLTFFVDGHRQYGGYSSPPRRGHSSSYPPARRAPPDPHTFDYPASLKQYADWFRYFYSQQAIEEDNADKAAEQEAGDGSKPRNGIKSRWEKYKKDFAAAQVRPRFSVVFFIALRLYHYSTMRF